MILLTNSISCGKKTPIHEEYLSVCNKKMPFLKVMKSWIIYYVFFYTYLHQLRITFVLFPFSKEYNKEEIILRENSVFEEVRASATQSVSR